jgi:hypothetical protein
MNERTNAMYVCVCFHHWTQRDIEPRGQSWKTETEEEHEKVVVAVPTARQTSGQQSSREGNTVLAYLRRNANESKI